VNGGLRSVADYHLRPRSRLGEDRSNSDDGPQARTDEAAGVTIPGRRWLLAPLLATGIAAAATALAQDDDDAYQLPEPVVHSPAVLKLPPAARCDRDRRLRVRFRPPPGAVFGWFRITVRGREVVRLTGVPRAASATFRLPAGRSTVGVAGETLGGQRVRRARVYRTCATPRPAAPGTGPISMGGGED
jgi:hypothetical protein